MIISYRTVRAAFGCRPLPPVEAALVATGRRTNDLIGQEGDRRKLATCSLQAWRVWWCRMRITITEVTNASECNCSDPSYWYTELCDCDYPETTATALIQDALPLGLWYGLVLILGAIGNTLVITVVIRYRKMRSFTNILLASLSTADLLIVLFCLPVQYSKYLSHSWIMGAFLCISFHYVQLLTMICSLMTMTVISIQRYLAIAFPMQSMSFRSKRRALRTVLITWMSSALLAIPILFGQELEVYNTPKNVTVSWCWRRFSDEYWEKVFVLYQFVVLYLGPFVTMAISYILLIRHLYFVGPACLNNEVFSNQKKKKKKKKKKKIS